MSGFATEFKNMKEKGGAPKIDEATKQAAEAAALEADNAAPAEVDADTAILNFNLTQTLSETVADETKAPPDIPAPKVETAKKIVIAGKEFNTVEEAVAFAEFEAQEAAKQAAYAKGVIDSTKPKEEPKPVETKRIKKIADKLFENPDEAMEDLESYVTELVDKKIAGFDQEKTQAQIQAETRQKTWDSFYKQNADLAEYTEEVQLVLDKNWDSIKDLKTDAGLAKIAELSRAHIQSQKEKYLPKTTLSSKPAVTASASSKSTTATNNPATKKDDSFLGQVRTLDKRNAGQREV